MKKVLLLMLFCSISMNSQNIIEKTSKFEFHSVSFSPISVYLSSRNGGLGGNIDLSINKGKHILKLYIGAGSEISLFSVSDEFAEYNLMYGREFLLEKWLSIDFFVGLGYFNFKYNKGSTTKFYEETVVGFPIQSKIRFKTGRIFYLGLQLSNNLNTATSVYNPGLFLQWRL